MSKQFICPLPWMSLSFGPNSVPRVCCHQNGILKNSSTTDFSTALSLSHNEQIRKKMTNHEIPSECIECHQLEALGCSSPRQQYLELFKLNSCIEQKNKIEYLDITIDNRCNLECIMCSPHYSNRLNSFFTKGLNFPSIEKWELSFENSDLDSILPDLKMLTLTGGEPLLSAAAMRLLRHVSASAHASHIDLRLFSNITILPLEIEQIFNNFNSVEFILSIDSIKDNYEFIRYPAKWSDVNANIQNLLKFNFKNTIINFHAIIMASNWMHLGELIQYYQQSKINPNSLLPIFVEIENPTYLHPKVLTQNDFREGLLQIKKIIHSLNPVSNFQTKQRDDFVNLINKIEARDCENDYINYKNYMNKIKNHRGD